MQCVKKPIIFHALVGAIIDRPKMQRYFLSNMFGRIRKYCKIPIISQKLRALNERPYILTCKFSKKYSFSTVWKSPFPSGKGDSVCQKSGHCEPVITLLRAKSRLRRLRSVRACGRSGVAIPHKKQHFLVRKPGFPAKTGRSPHQPSGWFAMTLFLDSLSPPFTEGKGDCSYFSISTKRGLIFWR